MRAVINSRAVWICNPPMDMQPPSNPNSLAEDARCVHLERPGCTIHTMLNGDADAEEAKGRSD